MRLWKIYELYGHCHDKNNKVDIASQVPYLAGKIRRFRKMAISKLKRRYTVTLTPANVDRFHALCKRLGLPPATMSNACDDVISTLSDTFQMALEKGTMELSDLFRLMGKQMELTEEVNRTDVKQKRH